MSEFRRFVTYINRYQGNDKTNNTGFAKIESRGEQCRLEIHMKGAGYARMECPVYLFVREKRRLSGILIGKLSLVNGSGEGRFIVNSQNINQSGYSLQQVGGFFILATEEVMFASLWDEGGISREQLFLLEKESSMEAKEQKEQRSHAEVKEQKEQKRLAEAKEQKEGALQAAEAAVQPNYFQVMQGAKEQKAMLMPKSYDREASWEERWRFILDSYPVMTPFEEAPEICCVRLELKDLRLLPKCYWYLGNNSFLLHGFFNYRYLILGAMEQGEQKQWFLGVPGVFQSQERVLASVFGFPEYKSEKIAEHMTGQFGYWYRFIHPEK